MHSSTQCKIFFLTVTWFIHFPACCIKNSSAASTVSGLSTSSWSTGFQTSSTDGAERTMTFWTGASVSLIYRFIHTRLKPVAHGEIKLK